MDTKPNSLKSLFEDAGDYLETRLDLLKLQAIDKSSDITSSIVSGITIFLLIIFAVIILNIGLAIWIGTLLGEIYLGFFTVGGFYALLAILLFIFRHSWLKEPVSSMMIKKMLN